MARAKKVETEVKETPVQTPETEVVVYDTVSKTVICIPVSQVTPNHKYI